MSSYTDLLLKRFVGKGILLDSNLLLLYFVGSCDRSLIGTGFKKLDRYTPEDFDTLARLITFFKIRVTTPHVLTEVSNLTGALSERKKAECLSQFTTTLNILTEMEYSSFEAARRSEFRYLGLTDCVLADHASRFLVVTDDLRLFAKLSEAKLDALNFNHIRTFSWNWDGLWTQSN